VLALLVILSITHGIQNQSLGYFYGFKGQGNPFFEITSALPGFGEYYGLLSGPAYILSYSIAGIFWGIAADKFNRTKVLTFCAVGWSLCSFFSGNAENLFMFAFLRFMFGIL
jgi:MFS family permease